MREKGNKEAFEPAVEFRMRVQRKAFEFGIAVYPGSATVDGVKDDNGMYFSIHCFPNRCCLWCHETSLTWPCFDEEMPTPENP